MLFITSIFVLAIVSGCHAQQPLLNEVHSGALAFVEVTLGFNGRNMALPPMSLLLLSSSGSVVWSSPLSGQTGPYGQFVVGVAGVSRVSQTVSNLPVASSVAAVLYYNATAPLSVANFTPGSVLDAVLFQPFPVANTNFAALQSLLFPSNPSAAIPVNQTLSASAFSESFLRCAAVPLDMASWNVSRQSPGLPNLCPVLVINEINPIGVPSFLGGQSNEFIELYDGGKGFTNLTGYAVAVYDKTNMFVRGWNLRGFQTDETGYFTMACSFTADFRINPVPAAPPFGFINVCNVLPDDGGALVLVKGTTVYTNLTRTAANISFVDAVVYGSSQSAPALLMKTLFNNSAIPFPIPIIYSSISRCIFAEFDQVSLRNATPTPGTPNACPVLLLNEIVSQRQQSPSNLQFVELISSGDVLLPLNQFVLVFFNQSGMAVFVQNLSNYSTDSSGRFVIGASNVPNVGLVIPNNVIDPFNGAVGLFQTPQIDSLQVGSQLTTKFLVDVLIYGLNNSTNTSQIMQVMSWIYPPPSTQNLFFTSATYGFNASHCIFANFNQNGWFSLSPTPGTMNLCSTLRPFVINEVNLWSNPFFTPPLHPYVELFDSGTGYTQLSGLVMVFFDDFGETTYVLNLDSFVSNQAGYFLVGVNGTAGPNDFQIPPSVANNIPYPGAVAIYIGSFEEWARPGTVSGVNLVDAVVYSSSASAAAIEPKVATTLTPGSPPIIPTINTSSFQRCLPVLRNSTALFQVTPRTPLAINQCSCTTVSCQNGGTCNGGICSCPMGTVNSLCSEFGWRIVPQILLTPLTYLNLTLVVPAGAVLNNTVVKVSSGFIFPSAPSNRVSSIYYINSPAAFSQSVSAAISGLGSLSPLSMFFSTNGNNWMSITSSTTLRRASSCPAGSVCGSVPSSGYIVATVRSNCDSTPCTNGGSCSSTSVSFICACPAGFTGSQCQSSLSNPCTSNPCRNSGSCVLGNGGNSFTCACVSGTSGSLCQSSVNLACSSNPCSNAGTCVVSGSNGFTCVCPATWTGLTCQSTTITACSSSPCSNFATCSLTASTPGYACNCVAGSFGSQCQFTFCDPNPCLNFGTCAINSAQNNFVCTCTSAYSGPTCATPSSSGQQSSSSDSNARVVFILVGVAAALIAILVCVVLGVVYHRRQKRKRLYQVNSSLRTAILPSSAYLDPVNEQHQDAAAQQQQKYSVEDVMKFLEGPLASDDAAYVGPVTGSSHMKPSGSGNVYMLDTDASTEDDPEPTEESNFVNPLYTGASPKGKPSRQSDI